MKKLPHVLTVFRRELAAYFNAAIAYIFIIVFIFLNGGLFMTQFFVIGLAEMRPFFALLPFVLSIFLPAVTMRLWAEEKRGNTLELLLTFPMATHELVIGKFLASLFFYAAALASTLTIPVMLHFLGQPDMGAIAGGYLGAFLLGSFFLAIGIFISGLCKDQIVAFITAMIICLGLYLTGTEFIASSIDGWIPGLGSFLRQFIGCAGHYESFARGVADNRDILYFLAGTVIFLVLNGYWLEGRMKPGAKKIFSGAVMVSLAIFLAGNWLLAGVSIGRFDLTEGKLYTISKSTEKIFKSLKTPVTAKYYVSPADKMPTGMKTLEQEVVGKLDELRVASGGKFQYKIFHMEAANVVASPEKQEEDSMEKQLQKKGIQPFQVRAIESDEVAVRLVYSSISLAYKEKPEETIARVIPENIHELEYMVMARVYRMTLPEIPKVTIVAPFQDMAANPELAAILRQLGAGANAGSYREDPYELLDRAVEYEGYEVRRIRLVKDEPIPAGTKTLVIIEPKGMDERQKYEINRFLRGGGSVFMAVQNYNYKYQPVERGLEIVAEDNRPNVNSLLRAWGVEVEEAILVDQQHDLVNLSSGGVGPFEMSVPVKVPTQILVTGTGMNPDVSITSRLSPIFYLWGTALKFDDAKIQSQGLKVEKLLSSTRESWTAPFAEGTILPELLANTGESRQGPFMLAAFIQGQFADAYAGKKDVPSWSVEGGPAPAREAAPAPVTPAPGKLILVGASTPFQKSLIRGGGHLNFFMNSVDALTLGDALIDIRSKQPIDRSIGRISSPAKVAWKFFAIFFIPIAAACAGASRVLLRRRTKQNYMKSLASAK